MRRCVLKTLYLFCKGSLINQVLETRFPSGRYVEKMPYQTWSDQENRVFETRFIAQNQVFETWDVSKIYTFETMPTNYIVRKMGLIPNFGRHKAHLWRKRRWEKISFDESQIKTKNRWEKISFDESQIKTKNKWESKFDSITDKLGERKGDNWHSPSQIICGWGWNCSKYTLFLAFHIAQAMTAHVSSSCLLSLVCICLKRRKKSLSLLLHFWIFPLINA